MNLENLGRGPKQKMPPLFGDVTTLHEFLIGMHKKFYADADADAVLQPMVFVVCENGDVAPIMTAFDGDDTKDAFAAFLRENFPKWGVVRYAFFAEAWAAVIDHPKGEYVRPSQSDNRKEIVATVCIDRDGTQKMSTLELVRDWQTGKVIDLVTMDDYDGTGIAGRFAELF